MYRVYLGNQPLTKPIVDDKRAALAYNLMNALTYVSDEPMVQVS